MNKEKKIIHISKNASSLFIIVIIILLNLIARNLFFRIDLTSEKRYTISHETKQILKELDDVVFIRIYLDGELNNQLQQFQKNITELLDEFRVYSRNIEYELVDPFEDVSPKVRNNILSDLNKKGLSPINIHHKKKDGSITEKIIIPGAIVIHNGIEMSLNLLMNNPGKSSENNLNNSIESLEYNFISTIKNLTYKTTDKIAFIEGHGEFSDPYLGDIMKELSKSYQVDRGIINGQPYILDNYKAIVIAGPVKEFSESDKFVIDQYIMKGGKVLWLIDPVMVDFDSLANGSTLAFANNLNLEDMLFRYGIRLNPVLIQDAQCSFIPINVALKGSAPNFQSVPWLYYPLFSPPDNNLISQNLNLVYSRFASTIDTIGSRNKIKKTPLLISSGYSKVVKTPTIISLSEINNPPSDKEFNAPQRLTGVLLEGKFESVFRNRMVSEYVEFPINGVLEESESTKMIVIADADIIRNDVQETSRGISISPLGFDRYTNQTYGNKNFLINAINYLADDTNLLKLRGREFKLRLLSRSKLSTQIVKWQVINLIAPLLLLIISGFIFYMIRKAKYSRL